MLTILIITYNSQNQIIDCLESINNSLITDPANPQINIVIIDNHSQDQTVKAIKQYQKNSRFEIVLITNTENSGFAKAVNQGFIHVQAKYHPELFLLLNPDAILDNLCLTALLSAAKKQPRAGLISASILDPKTQKHWFLMGKIHWLKFKTSHQKPSNQQPTSQPAMNCKLPSAYLTGCCLLIKKNVIARIGLFDERFFLYYEDADFSIRAQKAGFGLWVEPTALCFHHESQSSSSDLKTYNLVKNGLIFFHIHNPRCLIPYFWLIFYLRWFYHHFCSHKKPVTQAIDDFHSLSHK